MNLFYQPLLGDGVHQLDTDESRHCARVLRHQPGDVILVTDGQGFFYNARITRIADVCHLEVINKTPETARNHRIHIAISPTKNADRIEWFVEKAVELGVDTITLVMCEHTERTFIKTERLNKVAISAMKQSLKASLPVIQGPVPVTQLIRQHDATACYIAYVDQQNPLHLKAAPPGQRDLVLIGPEGDFTAEELQLAQEHGFKKVSLGTSRLRTETAGLAACHILHLIQP